MKLSIIVNFYNMQREAQRTLYTLSSKYQKNVCAKDYEVIAIDNGSSHPISFDMVKSFGRNFRYYYFKSNTQSPCAAINGAVKKAKYKYVMLCIDGARMLSPNIVRLTLNTIYSHKNPFVFTIGFHLGHKMQNYLIEEGYTQKDEDILLNSVDWRNNGYNLFKVSSLAASSKDGYFSEINESNCFAISKKMYYKIGGYDEGFKSAGGGIVNLHIFNTLMKIKEINPILLLGEGTFHQLHGGIATNVKLSNHPWKVMIEEYKQLTQEPDFISYFRKPLYYGHIPEECRKFLTNN